ncbi:MAG: hypothetical protein Ct9H90mP25_5640 [Gammaproteobacteria bacterium]|nr:MAG: hypothetical protein Ct9H90mP25_5640 [Gammaproteobacteria bacterium]
MRKNQLPEAVKEIGQPYPGNVFGLDFAVVDNSDAFQKDLLAFIGGGV